MLTLRYTFDDEQFDYDVDRIDIEKRLCKYLNKYWTREELIEYIINNDGCQFDYMVDFLEEIHDIFKSEAEEFYYNGKEDDYD